MPDNFKPESGVHYETDALGHTYPVYQGAAATESGQLYILQHRDYYRLKPAQIRQMQTVHISNDVRSAVAFQEHIAARQLANPSPFVRGQIQNNLGNINLPPLPNQPGGNTPYGAFVVHRAQLRNNSNNSNRVHLFIIWIVGVIMVSLLVYIVGRKWTK